MDGRHTRVSSSTFVSERDALLTRVCYVPFSEDGSSYGLEQVVAGAHNSILSLTPDPLFHQKSQLSASPASFIPNGCKVFSLDTATQASFMKCEDTPSASVSVPIVGNMMFVGLAGALQSPRKRSHAPTCHGKAS